MKYQLDIDMQWSKPQQGGEKELQTPLSEKPL